MAYALKIIKNGSQYGKLLHRNVKRHHYARLEKNAMQFASEKDARAYRQNCDAPLALVKTLVPIKPKKVRKVHFRKLPKTHQQAIKIAAEGELMYDRNHDYMDNFFVRVETYKTSDIKRLVKDIWDWRCELKDLTAKWPNDWNDPKAWAKFVAEDRARVKKILRLIPKEGIWPYVSYWADDMNQLQQTEIEEDGATDVINHGDGWHRIIASIELKRPTIDIVFLF